MKVNDNTIDISRLTVDMVVKNFKELCMLLDQPVGTGNQKMAQLENFKRYFSYEKQGWKFIIKEIYDTPLPSNKIAHNSKYIRYVQDILLAYLSDQDNNRVNLKKSRIYQVLGLVNDKYYIFHNNKKLLKILSGISADDIIDFYQRADDKLNRIFNTSLDSLQRRGYLNYYETYIIGVSASTAAGEISYHEASERERQLMAEIMANVLKTMHLTEEREVYFMHREFQYFKLLNQKLNEHGLATAFRTYHLESKVNTAAKDGTVKELNSLVVESLDIQATKRFNKEQEALRQMAIIPANPQLKYPESYVHAQKTLSNHLIKL